MTLLRQTLANPDHGSSTLRVGKGALLALILLSTQHSALSTALAHTTKPLDAYGCHATASTTDGQTRECHADLLAGQTFPSLQAELKAYIDALRTQHAALQAEHSALTDELFVVKGELELAKIKLGGLADAAIYSCAIRRFTNSGEAAGP